MHRSLLENIYVLSFTMLIYTHNKCLLNFNDYKMRLLHEAVVGLLLLKIRSGTVVAVTKLRASRPRKDVTPSPYRARVKLC